MVDQLITPAESGPVTLALAKKHLVIDHTVDDELIQQCIDAATEYAEEISNRGFVTQTWKALLPAWPVADPCRDVYIELKRGKLVTAGLAVKYVDTTGAEQTLDPTVYLVDDANDPGRIRLAPDQEWPDVQARWDAVRITYTVGWAVGDVPKPIVQALLLLIAHLYEYRTPVVTGTIVATMPLAFDALLTPFKILSV